MPDNEVSIIGDITDEDVIDTAEPDPEALLRLFKRVAKKKNDQNALAIFIIAKIKREWRTD